MSITIEIPTAFRRFTEGAPKVDSGANTVAEALNDLTSRFPALRSTSVTKRPNSAVLERISQ